MDQDTRVASAVADGAEILVRQLEQCQRIVSANIDVAWTEKDVDSKGRGLFMDQALQFMRLAGEIGTALAKLKPNALRQHIAIERIEPPKKGSVVWAKDDGTQATRIFRDDVTGEVVVFEAVPPAGSAGKSGGTVAGQRGEGEGYDKQLGVVGAELEPTG